MKTASKALPLVLDYQYYYSAANQNPTTAWPTPAARIRTAGYTFTWKARLHDIGYQHGYLVAKEIDTLIKVMQFYLPHTTKKNWAFYRAALPVLYGKRSIRNTRRN